MTEPRLFVMFKDIDCEDERERKELVETFDRLERAALAGERCPKGEKLSAPHAVWLLARLGFIRIEIFARNFRRITITAGKNEGAMTAAPRNGQSLYLVIDKDGRRKVARERLDARLQSNSRERFTDAPGQPITHATEYL